jgi:hypothetical protein
MKMHVTDDGLEGPCKVVDPIGRTGSHLSLSLPVLPFQNEVNSELLMYLVYRSTVGWTLWVVANALSKGMQSIFCRAVYEPLYCQHNPSAQSIRGGISQNPIGSRS